MKAEVDEEDRLVLYPQSERDFEKIASWKASLLWNITALCPAEDFETWLRVVENDNKW